MISKDAKITVVGAGAIGGITAAFIKKAGWDPLIVCNHQETADLSTAPGIHITGTKGDHTISLKAVKNISDEVFSFFKIFLIRLKSKMKSL